LGFEVPSRAVSGAREIFEVCWLDRIAVSLIHDFIARLADYPGRSAALAAIASAIALIWVICRAASP